MSTPLARPAGARPRTRSPDRQTGTSDPASRVGPVADRVRAAHVGQPRAVWRGRRPAPPDRS